MKSKRNIMLDSSGKPIDFDRGFKVLELNSWENFQEFVARNQNLKGYIFRGQRCGAWSLQPTLTRILKKKGKILGPEHLSQQLFRFRLAIRGRINLAERELLSSSELWSIGQHHGLGTPLLDWTASPLVAGFFAFSEPSDDLDSRSVFALWAKRINELFAAMLRKNLDEQKAGLSDMLEKSASFAEEQPDYGKDQAFIVAERIVERLLPAEFELYSAVVEAMDATEAEIPRIVSPFSGENQRLVNQRGLFTKFTGPDPLDQWVTKNFREKSREPYAADQPMLLKLNLPTRERDPALSRLDAANINYLSLFPDVDGAALFTNEKL